MGEKASRGGSSASQNGRCHITIQKTKRKCCRNRVSYNDEIEKEITLMTHKDDYINKFTNYKGLSREFDSKTVTRNVQYAVKFVP